MSDMVKRLIASSNLFDLVFRAAATGELYTTASKGKTDKVSVNVVRGLANQAYVTREDGSRILDTEGNVASLLDILANYRGEVIGNKRADGIVAIIAKEDLVPAIAERFPELNWETKVSRGKRGPVKVDLSGITFR